MRQPKPFRQRFGKKRGLVEPPLAFPVTMQRYRHNDIRLQRILFPFDNFSEPIREPCAQGFYPLEFQYDYCPRKVALIKGKTSRPVKSVGLVTAGRTNRQARLVLL